MSISQSISTMRVDKKKLTQVFDGFMQILKSPYSTEQSIVAALTNWQKTAYVYLENKQTSTQSAVAAKSLPASFINALYFVGQKTGVGKIKEISTEDSEALKRELKDILKLSILMARTDDAYTRDDLHHNTAALLQHESDLTNKYSSANVRQNTVSSELRQITEAIEKVARERFGFAYEGSRNAQ
jgi:hypothetical protein